MHNLSIKKVRPNNKRKTRYRIVYQDEFSFPVVLKTFRTEAKAKTFVVRLIFAIDLANLPIAGYPKSSSVKKLARELVCGN
jgi:hypothetical protein